MRTALFVRLECVRPRVPPGFSALGKPFISTSKAVFYTEFVAKLKVILAAVCVTEI